MRIGIALFLLVVPAMALGSHGGFRELTRQYGREELKDEENYEQKSQEFDDAVYAALTYAALVVVIVLLLAWLAYR
jgi:hypothetical protein